MNNELVQRGNVRSKVQIHNLRLLHDLEPHQVTIPSVIKVDAPDLSGSIGEQCLGFDDLEVVAHAIAVQSFEGGEILSPDELTKAQFEQVIEGFLEHFKGDLVPTEILKHVVRHEAAIRTRCEKAEQGQGQIDLYRDEFMRIKALDVNGEVNGICDRAVKDIERKISVIAELESTVKLLAEANQNYEDMRLNRDNVITQAIARESLLIRKLHEKDRQLGALEQQLCNFQEDIDSLSQFMNERPNERVSTK